MPVFKVEMKRAAGSALFGRPCEGDVMAERETWCRPGDIRFTIEQVKWLVGLLPLLREGRWPPDPGQSGHTGLPAGRKTENTHAPFETPALIAAELELRIIACGADGWLVKAVYGWGEDHQTLGISGQELSRRVGRCLKYISGWSRKKMTYQDFLNHRKAEQGQN
jgi:hypothetical protein